MLSVRHNQRDEPFGQAGRQDREDGERLDRVQGTRPRDVLILVRQRAPCSKRSFARSNTLRSRLPAPTGWC